MSARSRALSRCHSLYSRIPNEGVCVYCGERATEEDHFVPVSVASAMTGIMWVTSGRVLVPSCTSCNRIAGNKPFKSIGAKRRYIQAQLRRKYRKLLDTPAWLPSELAELDYSLRSAVQAKQLERIVIQRRLEWRNKYNPNAAQIASVIFKAEIVADFAPTYADNSSHIKEENVCKSLGRKRKGLSPREFERLMNSDDPEEIAYLMSL